MKSGFRSIREIAAWSLPRLQPADSREDVTLTPIQRGPVWKPHQIESIWDSILGGFPVGSLVVTEGKEESGKNLESGKHLQNYSDAPSSDTSDKGSEDQHDSKAVSCKLQLVDGQQRANAISWAYVDPWSDAEEEREGALWTDLCPAEGKEDERKYVLRMLTRSHPWGYQRNNPNARLHRGSYQEALECFALASQWQKDATWKAGKLDIRVAFPWDSEAPVPFSWVVQYVEDIPESSSTVAEVGTKLRKRLQEKFPGWEKAEKLKKAAEMLEKSDNHFVSIINAVREYLVRTQGTVPLCPVDIQRVPLERDEQGPLDNDSLMVLFRRIAQNGTPISADELVYSTLKSYWPESGPLIEQLDVQLMPPFRMVLLAARLARDRMLRDEKGSELPPEPQVRNFRNWLLGVDNDGGGQKKDNRYASKLRSLIEPDHDGRSDLRRLIAFVRDILCHAEPRQAQTRDDDFGLPPIVVCSIAEKSPSLLFFILSWLDRHKPGTLTVEERKAMVGFVTVLHWFADKPHVIVGELWKSVNDRQLWQKPVLQSVYLTKAGTGMVRLCRPETFRKAMGALILPGPSGWEKLVSCGENWWSGDWSGTLAAHSDSFQELALSLNGPKEHLDGAAQSIWGSFLRTVTTKRELVLFSQRQFIANGELFNFDPLAVRRVEDHDTPWDTDHILASSLPSAYYTPNVIKTLKEWNGNFRAWPLELNRSDQEELPAIKLDRGPRTHTSSVRARRCGKQALYRTQTGEFGAGHPRMESST